MSEKIGTGGYAFPFSPTGSDSEQNGLTLLDYFAAKALVSLAGNFKQLVDEECFRRLELKDQPDKKERNI